MNVKVKSKIEKTIIFILFLVSIVALISYSLVVKEVMSFISKPEAVVALVNTTNSEVISTPIVSNVITEDFENGLSSKWHQEMLKNEYSGAVSTLHYQTGLSSYRIELRKTDSDLYGSKRSEFATVDPEQPLQEHTYTFGMLLPKGGEEDYALDASGGGEILAQWQNVPDQGEEWTMPPLALHTYKGRYFLEQNWDDAEISTDDQIMAKGNHLQYDLGSYENDKGKWVNWSFHIKWGWLKSQNPILEIFKDGVKIFDQYDLPNTTNDKVGVHMKLGICKWNWAQPDDKSTLIKRIIYYDDVSIK